MLRGSGRILIALTISVALTVGCSGDPDVGPAAPGPTTSATPSIPEPSHTGAEPSPGTSLPSRPAWSSGPVTVVHSPVVPPVPLVTDLIEKADGAHLLFI
jgi:hypothetical protein